MGDVIEFPTSTRRLLGPATRQLLGLSDAPPAAVQRRRFPIRLPHAVVLPDGRVVVELPPPEREP
ncbi:MAG: hypothetical protein IT483_15780 [Gammaproteobacteria bacterium]|nr:hypothetical protein [Gammaproteobacteria bacterium]